MTDHWQYQLRVYLNEDLAHRARRDRHDPALQPLTDILDRHHATLESHLAAFETYLSEVEREGQQHLPLYKWTRATLEDPGKRAKHLKTFELHVSGNSVYPKSAADALEADLQRLVGGPLVTRMSRHDTNPADKIPIPPEHRS